MKKLRRDYYRMDVHMHQDLLEETVIASLLGRSHTFSISRKLFDFIEISSSRQYYFSRENIDRDGIFRGLMDDNYSIPLEQVIKAPRLASVNTTTEELKTAIETGSDLLVIVSSPDGISSLKRKDNCEFLSQLS